MMTYIKLYLPIFFILFVGILGTVDLLHPGFPLTHDGDVHLLRLTNFYQVLTDGILVPRWAPNVNWGYGQPVFEFFYPLPSYLGSALHFLGMSFANSLKLLLGLSLILSGITMYLWLSKITSKFGAVFGAFLYMFAPYRFVDIYVRGDVGESLALLFVPLVLYLMTYSVHSKNKYPVLLGGISLALLILCHNIVSLMTLPFILFYGGYLWFENRKSKQVAIKIGIIIVIGFLLSAFFWLPGLFEAKYTLKDIVTRGEYKDRFVDVVALLYGPWSYGGTGSFTVQMGIVQWIVVLLSVIFVLMKKNKQLLLTSALLLDTAVAIFLMLPVSSIVWSKILLLQNFQFPWRFLLITIFSTSVLGALFIDTVSQKMRLILVIILIGISFLSQVGYLHARSYIARPDNTFAGIFKGPSDTGESSPIWGIRFMESGYMHPLEVLDGSATIQVGKRTSVKHTYTVTAEKSTRLMENTLYFPGWHVLVDGRETSVEFQDEQHRGIMTFWIPQGNHTVTVLFENTKFRDVADAISIVSLALLLLFLLPLPKRFTIAL